MSNLLVITDVTDSVTVEPGVAPPAPTGLTITQIAGPIVRLDWSHTGTNLDRFEVLRRLTAADAWESIILAPASDFGAGPPYSYITASPGPYDFVVRALNATGNVSV